MAGITDDQEPGAEDDARPTPPVTPGSDERVRIAEGEWHLPSPPGTALAPPAAHRSSFDPFAEGGSRIDFAVGNARVHTFEAKGPLGFVLALVVLLTLVALGVLMFSFAIGVGAALAFGGALAAALGLGVARARRQLTGRKPGALDEKQRHP